MIWKLQFKTLLPLQIIGYSITLCIGLVLILTTINIYTDTKPLLEKETDVFKEIAVVVSKKISNLSTISSSLSSLRGKNVNRSQTYFSNKEINDLISKDYVKEVNLFKRANGFDIYLDIKELGMRTDFFFESIPDKYIETNVNWKWSEKKQLIPIIIPKDYLKLLNLGYAETKRANRIPLLSYDAVKALTGKVLIESPKGKKHFLCKIVGFTEKINSILVPENFIDWANENYGDKKEIKPNKILVEFKDPNNKDIVKFLKKNNYEINKQDLEINKLTNIFKVSFIIVFIISIVILVLSIAFVILSINLIFQRNKRTLVNLSNIGFSLKEISKFYNYIIIGCTIISTLSSIYLAKFIRNLYIENYLSVFGLSYNINYTTSIGVSTLILLISFLHFIIKRKIKQIIY